MKNVFCRAATADLTLLTLVLLVLVGIGAFFGYTHWSNAQLQAEISTPSTGGEFVEFYDDHRDKLPDSPAIEAMIELARESPEKPMHELMDEFFTEHDALAATQGADRLKEEGEAQRLTRHPRVDQTPAN